MAVDITFQPKTDGSYLTKRIVSSLAANLTEDDNNVEAGVLIAAGGSISKVLLIPAGLDALEVQVRKHAGTGTLKVQLFNSVDDITYETTKTQEYTVTDAAQIVKFDRWECSRYSKLKFIETGGAQSVTVSAKARVQL